MPKLYNYYRNYLTFFCKPTFIDQFSNEKIKNYGDLNAECFYKNNIERKKHINNDKKILDKNIVFRDRNKNNEINDNNNNEINNNEDENDEMNDNEEFDNTNE